MCISLFTSCILGALVSMSYGHYYNWIYYISLGALTATSCLSSYFLRRLSLIWLCSSFIIIFLSGVLGVILAIENDGDDDIDKKYTEEEILKLREIEFSKKGSRSGNSNNCVNGSGRLAQGLSGLKYHFIKNETSKNYNDAYDYNNCNKTNTRVGFDYTSNDNLLSKILNSDINSKDRYLKMKKEKENNIRNIESSSKNKNINDAISNVKIHKINNNDLNKYNNICDDDDKNQDYEETNESEEESDSLYDNEITTK